LSHDIFKNFVMLEIQIIVGTFYLPKITIENKEFLAHLIKPTFLLHILSVLEIVLLTLYLGNVSL